MIGKILGNRYEIVEKIGGGGMAVVYRAKCTLLNREVTVKALRPEHIDGDGFVERFRREAQAVAKLSHANIVNVYDVGQEEDIHYIVMEYVEGKNLKEYIKEKAPLPQEKAINIAKQIAEALEHAHEHGIIHRDIKPHNILITETGKVKVTDFGIAKAATAATVTYSGAIVGSVYYFSPEQAKGEITGPKSDIYSLGVVLHEMMTNQVPFEGETPIAIALKQIQEVAPSPSDINPAVTYVFEKVIKKAMAKNPEHRYQRAKELWEDLHNLESGSPTIASKDNFTEDFSDKYDTKILTKEALEKELATQEGKYIYEDNQEETEDKGKAKNKAKDKEKRKWRTIGLIAGVILMGLLVGAGGIALWSNLWGQTDEVTVPNAEGLTVEQATNIFEARGLELNEAGEEFHPEIQEGRVVSQNPEAADVVREGRTIDVIVSKGIEMVEVPDMIGKRLQVAEIDLHNAELNLGQVSEEFSDDVPEGSVISQNPGPLTGMPKGDSVDVTVSLGPDVEMVPVPNVVGMSQTDAENRIRNEDLKVTVREARSDEYFEGVVIDQDPTPGRGVEIEEGSEIEITVSSGPGPEPEEREYEINLTDNDPARSIVPNDGEDHRVVIRAEDALDPNGRVEHEGTYNFEDDFGETASVEVYGDDWKLEIWLDDEPVRTLTPGDVN